MRTFRTENLSSGAKTFALIVPCWLSAADADVCSGARCVRARSALVFVTDTRLTCRLWDEGRPVCSSDFHQILERIDRLV